jgi:hypothetical protein
MALSGPVPNNQLIKFRREVIYDFLRSSRFDPWMGDSASSPIVRMSDFSADGYQVNIPLVNQLSTRGVGAGVLSGAEEALDDYGFSLWTDYARNAVAFNKQREKDASFDIPSSARSLLRAWAKRTIRDDIVDTLLSIPTVTIQAGRGSGTNGGNRINGVRWADATAGQRNTWVTNNPDRVLFGALASNYSTTAATALANVDSTNDRLTAAVVSQLKRIAQATTASGSAPAINPYMTEGTDEEWYVLFVGSRAMRDLRNDPTMFQANRDARPREGAAVTESGGNPIFSGGSLVWDGVIVKEIPEITTSYTSRIGAPLATAGASSIPVEPVFLCGQSALAFGVGQMPRVTTKRDTDYDFVNGVGVEAQYGVAKIARANAGQTALKDFGMVTGFVSATADA